MGQNQNHAAKNKKIRFFFPNEIYSKLFVDLSIYNVFVLCVNLRSKLRSNFRSTLCLNSGVFDDFGCSVNLMKIYCARAIMKPF